jgi:hypothetical protein
MAAGAITAHDDTTGFPRGAQSGNGSHEPPGLLSFPARRMLPGTPGSRSVPGAKRSITVQAGYI